MSLDLFLFCKIIFWCSGLDGCTYVCTIRYTTSMQERELSINSLGLTNKHSLLALKKLIKFILKDSQIILISAYYSDKSFVRDTWRGRKYFIWELGFMSHVFCFSEHPYRPIRKEGAAVGRIHTDVFCASTPYHDPVTAGKEAAASWLLTQHHFTQACLTGYVQKLELVTQNTELCYCHVSNSLISLVSHL